MPVIQAMLGMSKQAAQRKYAAKISASSPAEVDGSGALFAQPIPSTTRSRTGEVLDLLARSAHRIIAANGVGWRSEVARFDLVVGRW